MSRYLLSSSSPLLRMRIAVTIKPTLLSFRRSITTPASAPATTRYLPELSVAEKVILITGGSRGLGLTQGEALAHAGATVYALDIAPTPSPEFLDMAQHAPNLHYRSIDVRDSHRLQQTVRGIGESEGRLDGMIAAAGVLEEVDALKYTVAQFSRIMDINVTGCFLSAQACAREMIRLQMARGDGNKEGLCNNGGGSIALVASMSGVIANWGVHMAAYNASKGAVHQLARNLAAEWGVKHGIRVNTLSPGYITTKMVEELFERFPERRKTWSDQNMLGRISNPEEYRGAAVFMMSDASSFMTGADLMIDGGHHAW